MCSACFSECSKFLQITTNNNNNKNNFSYTLCAKQCAATSFCALQRQFDWRCRGAVGWLLLWQRALLQLTQPTKVAQSLTYTHVNYNALASARCSKAQKQEKSAHDNTVKRRVATAPNVYTKNWPSTFAKCNWTVWWRLKSFSGKHFGKLQTRVANEINIRQARNGFFIKWQLSLMAN